MQGLTHGRIRCAHATIALFTLTGWLVALERTWVILVLLVPGLGNHGLWVSFMILNLSRAYPAVAAKAAA